MNTPASNPDFAVGQLWRCTGRSLIETPTLLINRIDEHPLGGQIFHATVYGVRVRNPRLPGGIMDKLMHVPVTRTVLEQSATTLEGTRPIDPIYQQGYREWKQAFDAGRAGSFGVPLATILEIIERGMNGEGR
ncbi:hypothetical protein [Lysobacter soli]|uniref:Uncharacterized protein n=1 Tax=Lysobacter soli TaxID=453783 RepID=A0A3D8VJZ0_9GAMM|nr:hypothetical protein [Lysobacter soli]RDY69677.1 hypothetical protein DX912_02745 [Lysobacter soli]